MPHRRKASCTKGRQDIDDARASAGSHDADELDTGPRSGAAGTERLCALTGEVQPVDDMIRFVVAPDGAVVPDLKRRLPGRGLWITATRQALRRGDHAQGCLRAASSATSVRGRISWTDRTAARAICARCARDGPQGPAGRGRLRQGRGGAHARAGGGPDPCLRCGAPTGSRKLAAACAAAARRMRPRSSWSELFTSAQLDLAFGRSNVIHAALLAGPESETFLARLGAPRALPDRLSGRPERSRETALKASERWNGMAETTEKTGEKKLSVTPTKT